MNSTVFRLYDELPTKLVAGYVRTEGATDGGLYFYDVSDGTNVTSASDLAGIPVKSFIPLSTDVMFAGAGTQGLNSDSLRGIYRSTNGGTNFSTMSDSDLPSSVLANGFAYDSVRDVLYATTASGTSGSGTIYH